MGWVAVALLGLVAVVLPTGLLSALESSTGVLTIDGEFCFCWISGFRKSDESIVNWVCGADGMRLRGALWYGLNALSLGFVCGSYAMWCFCNTLYRYFNKSANTSSSFLWHWNSMALAIHVSADCAVSDCSSFELASSSICFAMLSTMARILSTSLCCNSNLTSGRNISRCRGSRTNASSRALVAFEISPKWLAWISAKIAR